jgi:hypothetical protein
MRAGTAARDTRLDRGDGGIILSAADPTCDATNLQFRPRAGNYSDNTRAGLAAR